MSISSLLPARHRTVAGVLALLLVAAGCVSPDPRAEAEFSYADLTGGEVPAAWLVLRWDDGSGAHELRVPQGAVGGETSFVFPRVRTNTSGLLHVRASVVRAEGDTAAITTVALPLRGDWRWGIDVVAASDAQAVTCPTCMGRVAVSVRTPEGDGRTPPDTLYVVWSGTSISRMSVY